MSGYSVEFFRDKRNRCPSQEYLGAMPEEHRAKALKMMQLLQEKGPMLPRPYADGLRDKIRELRVSHGTFEHRFLYFFDDKKIIVTHGFLKKTNKVDNSEINLAIRYMNEWKTAKG